MKVYFDVERDDLLLRGGYEFDIERVKTHSDQFAEIGGTIVKYNPKFVSSDFLTDSMKRYLKHDVESTVNCRHSVIQALNATYGITKPRLEIKRVIFNPPATIIIWNDNTKSVVKCQDGEPYDIEKGFALAYLKKLLGNDNTFNKEIHKWVHDNDAR